MNGTMWSPWRLRVIFISVSSSKTSFVVGFQDLYVLGFCDSSTTSFVLFVAPPPFFLFLFVFYFCFCFFFVMSFLFCFFCFNALKTETSSTVSTTDPPHHNRKL